MIQKGGGGNMFSYPTSLSTPLTKLLAWQARPGTTHDGSGTEAETYPYQQQINSTHKGSRTKAETYSSISATNQHQLRQKIYQ